MKVVLPGVQPFHEVRGVWLHPVDVAGPVAEENRGSAPPPWTDGEDRPSWRMVPRCRDMQVPPPYFRGG